MVEYTAEQTDARLKYLDEARRFFIQVWRENPALLKHGDVRLIEMMAPIWAHDDLARSMPRAADDDARPRTGPR